MKTKTESISTAASDVAAPARKKPRLAAKSKEAEVVDSESAGDCASSVVANSQNVPEAIIEGEAVKKNKVFKVGARSKAKELSDDSSNGEKMRQSSYNEIDASETMNLNEGRGSIGRAYAEEEGNFNEQYSDSYADGVEDDQGGEYSEGDSFALAPNQTLLTLSYSLMSQVRQVARLEGVSPDDILIELIAEGVTKRAFQDMNRATPSHLMTRTGYVPPDMNGNQVAQPNMSHHNQMGVSQGRAGNQRRFQQNGNGFFQNTGNGQQHRGGGQAQGGNSRFSNGNQRGNGGNGGNSSNAANKGNFRNPKRQGNQFGQRGGGYSANGGGHSGNGGGGAVGRAQGHGNHGQPGAPLSSSNGGFGQGGSDNEE